MDEDAGMRAGSVQSKIRDDIASQDWSRIWVFDPEAKRPYFAYTVGLTASFGHPEIVVAGLPEESSEGVLGSVYSEISCGATFSDGDTSDGVLESFAVRFESISPDLVSDLLVQAVEFYGDQRFAALQLYWPDGSGHFPGDVDAPSWLNERQGLTL